MCYHQTVPLNECDYDNKLARLIAMFDDDSRSFILMNDSHLTVRFDHDYGVPTNYF